MALNIWKPLLIDRIHMNMSITSNALYSFAWGQLWSMYELQKSLLPEGRITLKQGPYSTRIGYYPRKKRKIADIEIGKAYKNRYFKLSLYPPKFLNDDFIRFKENLGALLPDFSYGTLFSKSQVSYIEIACDTLTQAAHSFIPFRKKTSHSHIFLDKHGAKGATYLGSRASNLVFCIYDKAKQLAQTQKVSFNKLHTRIEARMRKTKLTPAELSLALPNPFAGLCMVDIDIARNISSDTQWQLFLDTCASVGSAAALASLEKKERKIYASRLITARAAWWNPTSRWSGLATALKTITP